jgi:hypothetical protein
MFGFYGVILNEGEGPASERNDTHDHARILQILSDQFQLLRSQARRRGRSARETGLNL